MRSYLENHTENQPPMLRLITLASPHCGFFCGVKSACVYLPLPQILDALMSDLEYTDLLQNLIGAANYWRDPYHLQNMINAKTHLSQIDNLITKNEKYFNHFTSIDKLIMFGSNHDNFMTPW